MSGESMSVIDVAKNYPRSVSLNGRPYQLRPFVDADRDKVVELARSLPEENLLFLRLDITQPEAVDEWSRAQQRGNRVTILAESEGRLIGFCSLERNELSWTRHIGEIRVIVDAKERGRGLGSILAKEIFAIASDLHLSKIVARMVREQQGARRLFERLGFTAEALLTDWVIDRSGKTRDLVVMSHDVTSLTN